MNNKCFAYDEDKHKCKALINLYCECDGNCKFYKTREQYNAERELYSAQEQKYLDSHKK